MKKEFYAPARFRMDIPAGLIGVDGGLIFPAGIPVHTLQRRDLSKKYPHLQRRLLDPQLYLAGLTAATSRRACVNLASYGWFLTSGLTPYESAKQAQAEWSRNAKAKIANAWKGTTPSTDVELATSILNCVQVQSVIGCECIILPSPLTTDQATDYAVEIGWLDQGLKIASQNASNLKRLATIALSDTCLRGFDPWSNQLLDVIIDQVTARMPDGAYIVIEQANEQGYYCAHSNTVGSLLRLVYGLKQGGLAHVVVALSGMTGLLALAAGADAWSAGWYRGERRLRLTDLEDQEGRAVPSYYAHPLASEIHLQNDLDRLNRAGLLAGIADETPASRGLLRALRAGRSVNSVPEWLHRQSNVAAASPAPSVIC